MRYDQPIYHLNGEANDERKKGTDLNVMIARVTSLRYTTATGKPVDNTLHFSILPAQSAATRY
jgi:hypothetical protein